MILLPENVIGDVPKSCPPRVCKLDLKFIDHLALSSGRTFAGRATIATGIAGHPTWHYDTTVPPITEVKIVGQGGSHSMKLELPGPYALPAVRMPWIVLPEVGAATQDPSAALEIKAAWIFA